MLRSRCAGLAARRLRAGADRAVAVALGVDADRRHLRPHRHDQRVVRQDLRSTADAEHRRRGHAHDDDRGPAQDERRAARSPAACSTSVRASPGVADADGRDLRPGGRSSTPTASASAGGGAPNFIASRATPRASTPFTFADGPRAARRRRGRARQRRRPSAQGFKVGDSIRDRRAHGPSGATASSGSTKFGRRRLASAARRSRCSRCPRPSAWPARSGASTRSTWRPQPGVDARGAQRERCARVAAAQRDGAHRQGAGRRASPRTSATTSASCARALLAFAGIALFVGAFIIFNTFSITVAQRTREFALLRTLGATRRQVLRSVHRRGPRARRRSASLVGLALGIALAPGAARRCSRPSAPTCRRSGTVIADADDHRLAARRRRSSRCCRASLPAVRATRVPPVAALREGAVLPPRARRALRGAARRASLTAARRRRCIGVGLFGGAPSRPR